MEKLLSINDKQTLKSMLRFFISNGYKVKSNSIKEHLLLYMSNESIIDIIVTSVEDINIHEDYYKLANFSDYVPPIKISLDCINNNFIIYSTPPENIWMIIGNISIFTDGKLFRYKFCQMINYYYPNKYILNDVDYTNTFDGISKLEVLKYLGITDRYIEYTNLCRILNIFAFALNIVNDEAIGDLFEVIHNLYMYALNNNRLWILNEIKHKCFYQDYKDMKADKDYLYYMKCYIYKLINVYNETGHTFKDYMHIITKGF